MVTLAQRIEALRTEANLSRSALAAALGLAQRRQRTGVLLVAGTLATVPDWPLLCGALGHPDDVDGMRQRTVSCDVLADRPWDAALYARRLHAALERTLGE